MSVRLANMLCPAALIQVTLMPAATASNRPAGARLVQVSQRACKRISVCANCSPDVAGTAGHKEVGLSTADMGPSTPEAV